ncbi:MAG: Tfx family DNA-binding protein [Candidatus Methanoliparum thermophilum]|uniref:Tfx family DNA-binding protein n=1 Tax=Methanoliparum thermophilum TaxID=2491083 RepID=A0A520KQQ1_METT2|nr:Tfx family DNA-binding protein [Candidatus Methanoliparum sp. LAM-1]RZN63883.1 MAG: Tfx family DNA-binding protein [Candidatus Methanoliparum thermophilum]BDC36387.1 transcriptional regulator [Candidatus Methanoliparum sp. LAM-1]
MKNNNTILTDKQIKILKLRKEGLSQTEIAKMMRTTKQNISSIERTVWRKIEQAKNTLLFAKILESPLIITIKKNSTIDEAIKKIYETADKNGIHIIYDKISLIKNIKESIGERIHHRKILIDLTIGITDTGDVLIFNCNS